MVDKEFEFIVEEKDGDEWMQYAAGTCSTLEEAQSVANHYAHPGMRVTTFTRHIITQHIKDCHG